MIKKVISAVVFIVCVSWVNTLTAQGLSKEKLKTAILHMDSVMFDAFNNRNLNVIKDVFAKDVEFYQDRDGFGNYDKTIANFQRLFAGNIKVHRELIMESVEVYPIPGYGAVEIGTHKFSHTENGVTANSIYKFVHTWQYKAGQWKVTRAISVGH